MHQRVSSIRMFAQLYVLLFSHCFSLSNTCRNRIILLTLKNVSQLSSVSSAPEEEAAAGAATGVGADLPLDMAAPTILPKQTIPAQKPITANTICHFVWIQGGTGTRAGIERGGEGLAGERGGERGRGEAQYNQRCVQ